VELEARGKCELLDDRVQLLLARDFLPDAGRARVQHEIEGEAGVVADELEFQDYIKDLDRLTKAGKLSSRMTPRTLICGAIVLTSHRPMQLTANPVRRTAESLLAMIGHSLGFRAHP